ncbi:putative tetratricopeptide-like helical domain superfamily [Helianthus annuus]|nr:putative tetratricopeptide-like helical domain superfamily [Helianthus annuus]
MWEIDEDDNKNNETSPVETKGDLAGAEEYYLRALQADPTDGEVASQCAQLAWELHHDKDKASGYFGQALADAPTDSDILAAYAKFLWEAEDEDQHPDKL